MAAKEKGEAGENPLVPNAKLRAMYVAMLEARTLEEAVIARSRGRRVKPISIRGQEAVRVSTAIETGAGDLISDAAESAGMGSILGISGVPGPDAGSLLQSFSIEAKGAKHAAIPRLLPVVEDAEQRLEMALGAALALKAQCRQGVVVAYIRKDELSLRAYARLLKPAARYELPIIFVVLPRATSYKDGDDVAAVARAAGKSGVPGIPVDACDAVALYRVTQESLGRTRGGDGPVLIESVNWPTARGRAASPSDPIEHLKLFLLEKKISTPSWFKQAEAIARRRLKSRQAASKRI